MKKKKIILGSSSKFRKSLLKTLDIDFVCISPEIDESRLPEEGPRDMVLRLAIEKAKKISLLENNSLIISSDSCASCDGRILGKPLSEIKAVEHLEYISGKIIVFYTGICVLNSGLMDFKTDIAKYKINVVTNQLFVRENEIDTLVGSTKLLFDLVGEINQKDFSQTLREMYDA